MYHEGRISSFKDLMNEIAYSWSYPDHELKRDEQGNFHINNLFIGRNEKGEFIVAYKQMYWDLAESVMNDLRLFYEMLNRKG